MTTIHIDEIRLDGNTQLREETLAATVAEYAEAMAEGHEFPDVIIYADETGHWLADGFHRVAAYRLAGIVDIPADVRPGGQRDALLHAVGANAAHGLRRTNPHKRAAVLTLLADPEWSKWSDRQIAKRAGVSAPFVGGVRRASVNGLQIEQPRTVRRNGVTFQMDTSKIGRRLKRCPERLDWSEEAEEFYAVGTAMSLAIKRKDFPDDEDGLDAFIAALVSNRGACEDPSCPWHGPVTVEDLHMHRFVERLCDQATIDAVKACALTTTQALALAGATSGVRRIRIPGGGLPLTFEDVELCIQNLLDDDEWKSWSDEAIAAHIGCDVSLVRVQRMVRERAEART